ncbi:MAG: cupin domain-containing protein [Xanthomonadaceae bacterium]|nr:cupin domain-containing protein [Xanthomonadaceae bacterium]
MEPLWVKKRRKSVLAQPHSRLDHQSPTGSQVLGTFGWHSHDDEDELFLILSGRLRIEMEAGAVELAEGEMFVVPRGVRHNPVACEECHVLLIERKTTRHTGNIVTERTRSLAEQLGTGRSVMDGPAEG